MRRLVFSLVLAVFLAAPYYAHAAGPKVVLSTEEWIMGNIYQWSNPSTTVEIKNVGDEELKVLDVKASCGCTAVVLSDKVVKPGGKAELKIDFDSINSLGLMRKIVKITTNDPVTPEKIIKIVGFIKKDRAAIAYVSPEYIDLGVVAPYETRYISLNVGNKGNADLNVGGPRFPDGWFLDSSLPSIVAPGAKVAVRLGYRPPVKSGPINGEITVGFPGQADHSLKVAGYISEQASVVDSVVVSPAGFKVTGNTRAPLLELAVKNAGSGPVLIEGVDSSLDTTGTSVSASEIAPGDTGRVSVSLKPEGLKPGGKGYLYLRVAVPIEVEGAGAK